MGEKIRNEETSDNIKLVWDTVLHKPTVGIPFRAVNVVSHEYIDKLAGMKKGEYERNPESVYLHMLQSVGTCLVDQYIPFNPMKMNDQGYIGSGLNGPTTGAAEIIVDGMPIKSPEDVAEHLEKNAFPKMQEAICNFDEDARVNEILGKEIEIQNKLGDSILKCGYGFVKFPRLSYNLYGYESFLMAYALYPEIMERKFSLEADLAVLNNRAAVKAIKKGNLPPVYRCDHDMADSRSTLVDIKSLDRMWFPHFSRSIEPLVKAGIKLIWHSDGNLMQMVPRLIDAGVKGFQGFQYEYGMEYEKICGMKTCDGDNLIIMAGVSVTRTLPYGTPDDVAREMKWLVENGPETGLILGCSSSVLPGVSWANLQALFDGLAYYRKYGRKGL